MYLDVFPIEKWVFSSQLCDRFPEGIYPKCSMYGLFTYMKGGNIGHWQKNSRLPWVASGYVGWEFLLGRRSSSRGLRYDFRLGVLYLSLTKKEMAMERLWRSLAWRAMYSKYMQYK